MMTYYDVTDYFDIRLVWLSPAFFRFSPICQRVSGQQTIFLVCLNEPLLLYKIDNSRPRQQVVFALSSCNTM
jgi:hypothetical protein